MADIHELGAAGLRQALAAGELSATEVAEHFLARIGQLNHTLGAFVTVTADQAMLDAGAADAAYVRRRSGGPGFPSCTACRWLSKTSRMLPE
ncbi:glutamyl-tRNA(Gln) amidotransferase subunit A [Arthrobacter sp. Hiyo8]|nr:glutamyl-tRNA(Gln) amidotransferase subunit A [Arthrobacter sp. Hiyo8]